MAAAALAIAARGSRSDPRRAPEARELMKQAKANP
jgi:hypothetical protein